MSKLYKQKNTPHYTDTCKHPDSSYVGSIQLHSPEIEWLDVYVYEDEIIGTTVCIRYGNEDSQYYSPGHILNVMRSDVTAYFLAAIVIEKHGKITYERNK